MRWTLFPLAHSSSRLRRDPGPLPAPRRARSPVGSVLVAATLAVFGCAKPPPDASLLQADAEVRIDTMGIPHIYAASDPDAYFVSGYTMASMRLFQMEMVRRQAL